MLTNSQSHKPANQFFRHLSIDAVYQELFGYLKVGRTISTKEFIDALRFIKVKAADKDYNSHLIHFFQLASLKGDISVETSKVQYVLNGFEDSKVVVHSALPSILDTAAAFIEVMASIKTNQRELYATYFKHSPLASALDESSAAYLAARMVDQDDKKVALVIYKKVLGKKARHNVRTQLRKLNQEDLPDDVLIILRHKAAEAAKIATPKKTPAHLQPKSSEKEREEYDSNWRTVDSDAASLDIESDDDDHQDARHSLEADLLCHDPVLAKLVANIKATNPINTAPLIDALKTLTQKQKMHLLDEVLSEIFHNEKAVDNSDFFHHFSDNKQEITQGQLTSLLAQIRPDQTSSNNPATAQLMMMYRFLLNDNAKNTLLNRLVKQAMTAQLPNSLLLFCIKNWNDDIVIETALESTTQQGFLTLEAVAAIGNLGQGIAPRLTNSPPKKESGEHPLIKFMMAIAEKIAYANWDMDLLKTIYTIVPEKQHLLLTEIIRDYHGFIVLGSKIQARNAAPSITQTGEHFHIVTPSQITALTDISAPSSAHLGAAHISGPSSEHYDIDAEPSEYSFSKKQCQEVLTHQDVFTWLSPLMQQDFLRSLAKNYAIFTDTSILENGERSGEVYYNRLISQLDTINSYNLRLLILTSFVNPNTKGNPNSTHMLAFKELQCWMLSVGNYLQPDLVEISKQMTEENKGESISILESRVASAQNQAEEIAQQQAQEARITAITAICHRCSIGILSNEFPLFIYSYFLDPINKTSIIPQHYKLLVLLHIADRIQIMDQAEIDPATDQFWHRAKEHVTRFTHLLEYNISAIIENASKEDTGLFKKSYEQKIKAAAEAQLNHSLDKNHKKTLVNDIWDLIRYNNIIQKGEREEKPLQTILIELLDNTTSKRSEKSRGVTEIVQNVKKALVEPGMSSEKALSIVVKHFIDHMQEPGTIDAKFLFKTLLITAHYYNQTDFAFTPFTEVMPSIEEDGPGFENATIGGGSTVVPSIRARESIAGSSVHGSQSKRAKVDASIFMKPQGGKAGTSIYDGGSQTSSRMYQPSTRAKTASDRLLASACGQTQKAGTSVHGGSQASSRFYANKRARTINNKTPAP